MANRCSVAIRFFPTPPSLGDLISTIFLLEVDLPDGETVSDLLLPEWATLRFFDVPVVSASNRQGMQGSDTRLAVTGPHSQETRFEITRSRHWGVSLQPLGWARLMGVPAHAYANALVDGETEPLCARFLPLLDTLFSEKADADGEYARLVAFLDGLPRANVADEEKIGAISDLLLDPHIATSSEFAQRAGVCQRTLERTSRRVFGFTPKMLLRRRRFMRSLTDFMMDPSLKWIGAIDAVYHDQAHFVRDFHSFMGMKPSEYAALEKPIMGPVLHAREAFLRDEAKRRTKH
ncbi:MAG: helix-turn-helix domain-containing protein [Sphingomonadaceae bacterium]